MQSSAISEAGPFLLFPYRLLAFFAVGWLGTVALEA